MKKFKPQYMLDEQMYFADAKTSLLHQIREEAKETNSLLRKLVKSQEEAEQPEESKEEETTKDSGKKEK
ncbi:hypothetical protein [Bacillus infantis]|uniref:hypothetical protein n=1 Tax=Bacillus infantis TaxID=324767 RepID=UPI003CF7F942